jgi:hypothetical protein
MNAANSNSVDRNLTTKDHAALIRSAYKAAGIKASVRSESFSMGSSINVRVKSGSLALAKEIAHKSEKISRCEITGDILSGGNRYIEVDFDSSVIESKAAEVRELHLADLTSIERGHNMVIGEFRVSRCDAYDYLIKHMATGDSRRSWAVDGCVDTIARWLLEA